MRDIRHIGDIHHEAHAQIVLDTNAPVVGGGRGIAQWASDCSLWCEDQGRVRQTGNILFKHDRRQEVRRGGDRSYAYARSAAGRVDAERTSVKDAEAAAQRGLAVPEHVIGKADARSKRKRGRTEERMSRRLRLNDTRKRRAAESGSASGSERSLLRVGIDCAGPGIQRGLVRRRAARARGYRYGAGWE